MEIMVYLILGPVMVLGWIAIVQPAVEHARQKKIDRTNRIVQHLLDDYNRELELRAKFDSCFSNHPTQTNIINVDFVERSDHEGSPSDWKLVYNKRLGIYQKVPR